MAHPLPLPQFPQLQTPRPLPSERFVYATPAPHSQSREPGRMQPSHEHTQDNKVNAPTHDSLGVIHEFAEPVRQTTSSVSVSAELVLAETQASQFDRITFAMEQRLLQLESALQQANKQNADLQYQQSYYMSHSHPGSESPDHNMAKYIAKPDGFDGDIKTIDVWIFQMRNYLLLSKIPPSAHVQTAGTYLHGAAGQWFTYLSVDDRHQLVSFEAFASMLLTNFRPIDLTADARIRLAKITQTGSVNSFNNLFSSIVQRLPTMDMDEKIYSYRTKLKLELQERLILQEFTDVGSLMKAAVRVETLLQTIRAQQTQSQTNRPPNQFGKHKQSTSVAVHHLQTDEPGSSSEEEEGTSVSLNFIAPPKMTPEIRQHCITNNLCFRCRSSGHSSRTCPQFQSSNRNGNSFKPSTAISKKNFD